MTTMQRLIGLVSVTAIALTLGAPHAKAADGDQFMSRERQLTFEGRRAGEGYFSPDGKFLIFQSERDPANPFFQIFMLEFATGDVHRVSPGTGKTTCSFFRPGTDDVLFASTHLDPNAEAMQKQRLEERASGKEPRYSWDYDDTMDIFTCKRDGSQIKRLTDAVGYDAEGAYSPDGSKIVFCSLRDTPAPDAMTESERKYAEADPAFYGEIYLMNADGSNQTRLTDWPGYDGGPFFTPDGERIVWRHFEQGGMIADVYTMKLDGSDRRRLTDFGCMSWAPYFHPSGKYCIFNSNKLGMSNWELYIVDPLGEKEPVRVTQTEGADVLPVFSPDGKHICWTSTRHAPGGRNGQLYFADWDHDAALAAIKAAPARESTSSKSAAKDMTDSPLSKYADAQRKVGHDHEPTELERFAEKQREVERRLSPEITEADLREHVAFLASDELGGRMTGSEGARAAGDYIAGQFEAAGLKPLGDNGTYFQKFTFLAGVKVAETDNALSMKLDNKEETLAIDKDYRPLGLSGNGTFSGGVVFAGYGIVGEDYDSYGDLDVTDKCVVVLRYFPEDVSAERKTALTPYASLRVKAMHARRLGAKALLVVTGPNSPRSGELIQLTADGAAGGSGIYAASISLDTLNKMFALSQPGRSLKEIAEALDSENPHVQTAFDFTDLKLNLSVNLIHEEHEGQNVIGVLPATASEKDGQTIVIGAHYDHLGHGEGGNSFGYEEGKDQIYNGADDNGSGSAVLLELAAAFAGDPGVAGKPRKRDLVFAAWSGEEIGLIGSDYFANHSPIDLKNIAEYVNFDMVGRMVKNQLVAQGAGSSPGWRAILERRNVPIGFDLAIQDDPYLPTDSMSFYRVEVPTLQLFTGSHQDYHRPSDTAEKLNYPDTLRVARFAQLVISDLAQQDERLAYAKVERKSQSRGSGVGMRAYTGTEPDYAYTGSDGMKLKGVIPGGPADKAGVKPGDLIVEIDGLSITNVYEYANALSVLKPDKTSKMVVTRDGKRIELAITPTTRD